MRMIARPVDIMTVPGVEHSLLELVGSQGIKCEKYIQDVERYTILQLGSRLNNKSIHLQRHMPL